jgi:DNA-binding MarR family transcriptional regulator
MPHWTSDLHSLLLQISAGMNRPDVDERFLRAANVDLDRALFPLLSRIAAGGVGIVELAAQVGRTHSTISRQVAKLERLGLVERRPSASDGRIRLLRLSQKGEALVGKFAATRRRLMEDHFKDWSEAELQTLISLLKKAVDRPVRIE